jgi:hypothetical protein
MLKSYKDLGRWYPPLEPEGVVTASAARARTVAAGDAAFADDGAPRYPHYIRDTEPEPFDPAFVDEPPTRRSEFTGGWSDWVAGNHAPGPGDDYPVRHAGLVRIPWDSGENGPGDDRAGAAGQWWRTTHPGGRRPPTAGEAVRDTAHTPWHDFSDGSRTLRAQARPTLQRAALVLAIAVLLLAVVVSAAAYLLHSRGGRQSDGPMLEPMRLTAATGDAAPAGAGPAGCPTERYDRVVRGAEAGGTDSGPDAIMWFQHSYYVERSAERAWTVVAPAARVPPVPVIQRGIDSVPPGTAYCVRVVTEDRVEPQSEDTYSVEVTERRPGGAPATYGKQKVTTVAVDGRTLITSIAAG